jgi:hypothetical protein
LYLYSKGLWQGSGRANRKESDRTGWVDAQQVVEGGGGINECCAGGITVLYWVAVSFSWGYAAEASRILPSAAYEDGTDIGFRNVGF